MKVTDKDDCITCITFFSKVQNLKKYVFTNILFILNRGRLAMKQLPHQQVNDFDELEDINVCLEDNREDQVDQLVQRSFKKIKRKEQVSGNPYLKWLILCLILALLLGGLFQYFIGVSSIKNYLNQTKNSQKTTEAVSEISHQVGSNEEKGSEKIESTLISNANVQPKKDENTVTPKVDSNQPTHQVPIPVVKKEDPSKAQTKGESAQKKNESLPKLIQDTKNNKQNKSENKDKEKTSINNDSQKKKEEKNIAKDTKDTKDTKDHKDDKNKDKSPISDDSSKKKDEKKTKDDKDKDKNKDESNPQKKTDDKNIAKDAKDAKDDKDKKHQADNEKKEKDNSKSNQKKQTQAPQKKQQTPVKLPPAPEKKQDGFAIPRTLWTLSTRPNYFQILVSQNHQRFAQASNFTRNLINKQNYSSYLSEEGNKKIDNVFKTLRERIKNQQSNLQSHIQEIQKRLILLSVLYENGGIIIDDLLTITENFNWVKHINNSIYVNRGNQGVEPKVVGFYSPFYSSPAQKQNKKQYSGMEEVDRYMVLIPTIENYFIAAEKGAQFIGKLIEESISILLTPESIKKDIAEKKYSYIHIDDHDVYYQYFLLASQRVLLKRQSELDSSSKDSSTRSFAIDSFGLNLINCYYGPNKTNIIFESLQPQQKMQNIAKLDMSQLQSSIGPMRYVTSMTIFKDLNEFLSKLKKKSTSKKHKGAAIMKGSFLQKMYFPDSDESFIYENTQKSFVNQSALLWKDLPKTIWIFWDTGLSNISNVPAEVVLCVQNLKKVAESSGFTVKQVNNTNLKDYLSQDKIDKIQQALYDLSNEKYFKQIRCDLYRLALLHKHGGVYLDTSIISVQNFDWLANIAKFPSKLIQNRNGVLPQVLMFWDPYFGNGVEWKVNEPYHTKSQWLLQYQNSFIAVIKDSQFIKEWLNLFLQLSKQSVSTIIQTFEKCNVPNVRELDENSHSLLSINTAKCVLGRKQESLKKQPKKRWKGPMDFYGLWTMSSYVGPFKFKAMNNLDNLDRNGDQYFLTRYSQQYIEGIIGKINFFVKLTDSQRHQLINFIKNNNKAVMEESHSKSVFRKYLYNQKYSKFETVNDRTIVKLD